jgi:glucose-6-phosphate 1-dehydrogenase
LWNSAHIDHVQITVAETVGLEGRASYYDTAGALRDMVQNHLLQVLALIAMEPPVSLAAEPIRDEKVKLLSAVRRPGPAEAAGQVVRGQYRAGVIGSKAVPDYRAEDKVAPTSVTETFIAAKLLIDNWRWAGVPFYLRTGKALPVNASEIRVQFKPTPNVLFAAQCGPRLDANSITLRLQPDEGITLHFNGKIPDAGVGIRPVRMHFSYDTEFGAYTPEAYERLLLDALGGDPTLFIRRDEVEQAWEIVDALRAGWDRQPQPEDFFYAAGTWGPQASHQLLACAGHAWREPRSAGNDTPRPAATQP